MKTISTPCFVLLNVLLLVGSLYGTTVGEKLEKRGTYQELADNVQLNIRIQDNQFQAWLVNAENIVLEHEIKDIILEVDSKHDRQDNWRTLLEPASGKPFLTSPRTMYPPFNFRLRVIVRYPDENENKVFANWHFTQDID